MNLNQLRYVRAVAECGSFRKAGMLCNATQPTISNAIAQIEAELGGKLFARTTRTVSITSFGQQMLPLVAGILNGQAELLKAAESHWNPEVDLLRVGFSPLVNVKYLHGIIDPFRQANPNVSVFFKECFLGDLETRLDNEEIDIALIPCRDKNDNMDSLISYTESLVYIPQQKGATKETAKSIQISAISGAPIILTGGGCGLNECVRDLFQHESVVLNEYPGQAMSYRVIEEWASLGIGAGILPVRMVSDVTPESLPLLLNDRSNATVTFKWIWKRYSSKRVSVTDFCSYIDTVVPSLVAGSL